MSDQKKKRLLQGFYNENLSELEKEEFLEIASSDKEFVGDFINMMEREVQKIENKTGKDAVLVRSKKYHSRRKRLVLISFNVAALILAIIIILATFFPNDQQLYNRNYEALNANSYITRGESPLSHADFISGVRNYIEGNYDASWNTFNSFLTSTSPTPEIVLFAGLSLMGMKDYQKAAKIFEISQQPDFQGMPEIDWYLGLCYLVTGEDEKAIKTLNPLSEESGELGNQATKLLKKLSR